MNLLSLVAYFVAGVLHDFLVAKYYLYLSSHQRGRAVIFTVLVDFFGYAITIFLVFQQDFLGALSFALGTGLGTWVAMGKAKK